MTMKNVHECLWGNADSDGSYSDADPGATKFNNRLWWNWCWFMYQNMVLGMYDLLIEYNGSISRFVISGFMVCS